jgi:transposase InsO family protein
MCIKMPTNIKEERLRWVLPIFNKEIKLVDAIKVCPHSKRSLERWLAAYKKYGESGLESKSTRPKTNPNETPIRIKEKIITLRKDTGKCAKKISWDLEDERIYLHYQTVQKIIKNEGLTRKYKIRKIKYKYIRALLRAGELVEIDIKYVPKTLGGRKYYQYTAIDCASRWRHMKIYDSPSNENSIKFLRELIKVSPFHIEAIKTDNGVCFTNRYTGYLKSSDPFKPRLHPLDLLCQKLCIEHYLIDPGKPSQNGKVERSHREDQEKFYEKVSFNNFSELEYKIKLWNMYYNDLKHCSLNKKTPNQMVEELTSPKPPEVCI